MGVLPPKRCGKCLRCSECSDTGIMRSRKDQEELEMLQKNVTLVNGIIHVRYPFIRDPHCLPNNRAAVVRMAEKQERRLLKSGHLDYYNVEIQKARVSISVGGDGGDTGLQHSLPPLGQPVPHL